MVSVSLFLLASLVALFTTLQLSVLNADKIDICLKDFVKKLTVNPKLKIVFSTLKMEFVMSARTIFF